MTPPLLSSLQSRSSQQSLATVISYCSLDERFIRPNLHQALLCSDEIVVAIGDRLFDGRSEDVEHLDTLSREFPQVRFVKYVVDMSLPAHDRHNLARVAGYSALQQETDLVAFVDADEVLDGAAIRRWLSLRRSAWWNAQKLASYWYFREPTYRAKSLEDSVLVVKRSHIGEVPSFDASEREALFRSIRPPRRRGAKGAGGDVMVHHYSWVRTKEQMLGKVQNWGHRHDRDWAELVEEEFDHEFSGTDFVHGYEYEVVPPFVDV